MAWCSSLEAIIKFVNAVFSQKCCFLQCDHIDQGHSLDISKTPSLSTHTHTHELTSIHHGNGKQRIESDVHITQSGQAFPLGLQGKLGEQPWSTTWYAWHISSHLRSYLVFFSQILSSLSLPITRKFHACCGYEKHHNLTRTLQHSSRMEWGYMYMFNKYWRRVYQGYPRAKRALFNRLRSLYGHRAVPRCVPSRQNSAPLWILEASWKMT